MPHVHTHIVLRYPADPAPGRPLPPRVFDNPQIINPRDIEDQVTALKQAESQRCHIR